MRLFILFLATSSLLFCNEEIPNFEYVKDETTVPILNPTLVDRKVAKIRLKNGLEAYLVSDPETNQSGASLSVEAGSWSDPKEYPGMAHFCEHMLFLGTKAYPGESDYSQFITEHGGKNNAFTASNQTVYMFSINNEAFQEALNRFSHFFIDPLFNTSSVERELHAVDQEHSKNIENDGWRQYMILKETGNPAHPFSGFSTGNAQTLGGIPREALVNWYEANYCAGRMHLVVISSLPLDDLVKIVVSDFSSVPSCQTPPPSYPFELFSEEQKGHMIYIKPVKDIKILELTWQPPKQFAEDRNTDVFDLVAYALSYGGPGSLSELLKQEQLARSVSSKGDLLSQDEAIFELSIALTEKGVKNLNTVIDYCFQAINRLKESGIPEYLFQEDKQMSLVNYQYQTREDCFTAVEELGASIIYEPLETFPQKQNIPTTYNPTFIKSFIDTLTPETAIFSIQANPDLTGVPMTSKEKWMDADYTIKPIPQELLSQWKNIALNPHINLPPPNPFIPKNLVLVSDAPKKIAQDDSCLVYFKQDVQYQVPTGTTIFSLKSPLLTGSAGSAVLFDLYLYALKDKLDGTLSLASAAGFEFDAFHKDLKVTLMLSGYSDQTPELLRTIFQSLNAIHPTKEQFERYKEALSTSYQNASKDLPLMQGIDMLKNLLSNASPTSQSKYQAIMPLSYEAFLLFCKTAFKKSYVEGMIYGNFEEPMAKDLWNTLHHSLASTPYPPHEQLIKKVINLPETGGPFLISTDTQMQGNGVILTIEEGSFSMEKRGAQQILSTLLERDFFDTLRTQQQTGYIVQSQNSEIEKELFQNFYVQSSSYPSQDLLARFEIFLKNFTQTLTQNLTAERFVSIKSDLITLLEMPPDNQAAMAQRLNFLAFNYDGDFEWINKRIASLKELPYDFVLQSAGEFFSPKNLKRLAIFVNGKTPPVTENTTLMTNPLNYNALSPVQLKSLSSYSSK